MNVTKALNPVLLAVLRSPIHRAADRALVGVRYTGRKTGRLHQMPVMYVLDDGDVVIMPGWPERKKWWHNFDEAEGGRATLQLRGRTVLVQVVLVRETVDPREYGRLLELYVTRFPKAQDAAGGVLVRCHPVPVSS